MFSYLARFMTPFIAVWFVLLQLNNNSSSHVQSLTAYFLFLPHFDVICDLLLNIHTATWNLFVKDKLA